MRRGLLAFLISGWISQPVLSQKSDLEIPFDFLHNQIVLRVMLNGQGPFSFILDTGTRGTAASRR